jgi:hypothetical protein
MDGSFPLASFLHAPGSRLHRDLGFFFFTEERLTSGLGEASGRAGRLCLSNAVMKYDNQARAAAGETGSSSLPAARGAPGAWDGAALPGGLDFAAVRAAIAISDVLTLLAWQPTAGKGAQLRGPCPVHRSENSGSTSFSANLQKNAFRCFSCGKKGTQLDLFAAALGMPLYQATVELCRRLNVRPGADRRGGRSSFPQR